jgi:hypothetical protein
MRREKIQRHIAPVIAFVRLVLKNWHQLDHGDSKILKVGNFLDHPRGCSALVGGHTGIAVFRKAAHVHLVNDCVRGVTRPRVDVRSIFFPPNFRRSASVGRGSNAGRAPVGVLPSSTAWRLASIALSRSCHESSKDFAPSACRSAPSFVTSIPTLPNSVSTCFAVRDAARNDTVCPTVLTEREQGFLGHSIDGVESG